MKRSSSARPSGHVNFHILNVRLLSPDYERKILELIAVTVVERSDAK